MRRALRQKLEEVSLTRWARRKIRAKLDTLARPRTHAFFSVIVGAISLLACGLSTEGLGVDPPDGSANPEASDPGFADGAGLADDSSVEGSAEDAEASLGVEPPEGATPVAEAAGPDANDAPRDANDATAVANDAATDGTADRDEGSSDASADTSSPLEAASRDSGASEAASDANACVLPVGATMCCGSVACTDHGGSCSTPGICASCEATCTAARPFCCALGGPTVKCEVRVIDC